MLFRGKRRRYIETYEFPVALRSKLVTEFGDPYKADIALDGLRGWYLTCLYGGRKLIGMPSKAVDEAWHEMILMTREYSGFCERAFGRYRHHSPAATLVGASMDEMLTETLAVVDKHRLPMRLFTADAEAAIPGGYVWDEADLQRRRELIEQRRRERWSADGGGDGDGCGGGCGGCG